MSLVGGPKQNFSNEHFIPAHGLPPIWINHQGAYLKMKVPTQNFETNNGVHTNPGYLVPVLISVADGRAIEMLLGPTFVNEEILAVLP